MLLSRREAIGAGLVIFGAASLPASAAAEPFALQVEEGLAHFRRRARDQKPLVEALAKAIGSGELTAAQAAYVAARPPYEEIEVLAASFPERDADIDARPYAMDGGESNRDFKGFHKVEALLFRDEDLEAALSVAEELERSVGALARDLENRAAFSAEKHFAGMIALATEIPAKKISSEEETWSDRSLLIFRHNLIGIDNQYRPFASDLAQRNAAAAEAVDVACREAMTAVERVYGPDQGGTLYSRVGIADRKAISSAVYRYRDALDQAARRLELGS